MTHTGTDHTPLPHGPERAAPTIPAEDTHGTLLRSEHRPVDSHLATAVRLALDAYSPEVLLKAFRSNARLAHLLDQDARVRENYTIDEHTEMVLRQYDRYQLSRPLPGGISHGEFRLILGLHDIGKSIPADIKTHQAASVEVFHAVRDSLPLTERAALFAEALIRQDIIGQFIQSCIVERASFAARDAIRDKAGHSELTRDEIEEFKELVKLIDPASNAADAEKFEVALSRATAQLRALGTKFDLQATQILELCEIFYQSDSAAYTYDARTAAGRRASPGLDYLYASATDWPLESGGDLLVRRSTGGLEYSTRIAYFMDRLEAAARLT